MDSNPRSPHDDRTPRLNPRARWINAILAVLGRRSLRLLHGLGAFLGRQADRLPHGARTVATINLRHCYPDLSERERRTLRRRHFEELGRTIVELPALMHRPIPELRDQVVETKGEAHLHTALARGRGVILASPHLGAWEILPHWLLQHGPITVLYRPPRQADLGPLILTARTRSGVGAVETTPKGVRSLLAALRRGEMIGILPDQEPEGNEPFAPFFGQPAKTMTLIGRLAARADCPVLFTFAERLPAGQGYRIHFQEADPAIRSPNPEHAAHAVNAGVEACIRVNPAQYMWTYKRFNTLPDGGRLYPRRRRRRR